MKTTLLILVLLITLISCKQNNDDADIGYVKAMEIELTPPPPNEVMDVVKFAPPEIKDDALEHGLPEEVLNSGSTALNKKKIIKDGEISIKTKDITTTKKSIDATIKSLNAYYEVEDLQNNSEQISYNLKIRIPANNFEKLITSIEKGEDEITYKSINARDVTEEYFDTETRLANKRAYLNRYKELLSKAGKVQDILAIEENIRVLEEEIESKVGRLKYLNDQIAYSTLTLNLSKDKEFIYKAPEEDSFAERVKRSLGNGWSSVVNFALWLITMWPFIIVTIALIILIKRIKKKRKKSNKQTN